MTAGTKISARPIYHGAEDPVLRHYNARPGGVDAGSDDVPGAEVVVKPSKYRRTRRCWDLSGQPNRLLDGRRVGALPLTDDGGESWTRPRLELDGVIDLSAA